MFHTFPEIHNYDDEKIEQAVKINGFLWFPMSRRAEFGQGCDHVHDNTVASNSLISSGGWCICVCVRTSASSAEGAVCDIVPLYMIYFFCSNVALGT